MANEKIYRPAWRVRKAYFTATVVMGSYLWLFLKKKIFGQRYYERRIKALHIRNAERVKSAILQLEGLFIKIGQLLSILGSFFPEEFQKPLEELQDRIPPRPFEEVQTRFVIEFGKQPEEVFTSFEHTPIASASIGQAHRATIDNGTSVVVKIQHANIEQVAQVDLEIIRKLTRVVSWIFDIKGMDYAYTQVRNMIEDELDFIREAQSMQKIAKSLKDEPKFIIPDVHPEYCTGRIITTTWHKGVKISNTVQLEAWQIDFEELVSRLLRIYCRMVFKDGFYHADPHPGNILVQDDGTLVLLDFGAVAALSPQLREGIPQLIEAAVKNDNSSMIQALRGMGFIAKGKEADEMAGKMIDAMRHFLQVEIRIDNLNFKEIKINPFENGLLDLLGEIGISGISGTVQVPKDWVLLNRMATLLLGISSTLAPTLNPLTVARPYISEFVAGEKESLVSMVTRLLRNTATTTLGLPDELHRTLQIIEKGKLETLTPDIREGSKLLYQVGQQFVLAILLIASATFGYLFYTNGYRDLSYWGFGVAGFFMLLLLRSLYTGSRIRKRLE